MKTLLRGIGYIATAIAALCLLFIAINWSDETLRPEVQAALAWKAPDNAFADNGYLILLGMNAPAGQDAAAVGKQILQTELARYQAYMETHEVSASPEQATSISFTHTLCNAGEEPNCVEFYLAQGANKRAALLKDYRYLSDRFRAIRLSKNYIEAWPPYSHAMFPNYANLINAAKLEQVQGIHEISHGDFKRGVERLVENAQFSRRLLRDSNTLISHLIALTMIRNDMRFLSELLEKYPKLARHQEQWASVAAPISGPEYSLAKAYQHERTFSLQALDSMRYRTAAEFIPENNVATNALLMFAVKRNATLNLNYDLFGLRVKTSEAAAHHLGDAMADAAREKDRLFGLGFENLLYLKNPGGKILLQISDNAYEEYIRRQHDIDGYVRLVAMQLKLIAEHVPAARIPEALEESGPEFRSPYTLQPMEWDAAASELRFHGRQDSTKEPDKKHLYAVKIPRGET